MSPTVEPSEVDTLTVERLLAMQMRLYLDRHSPIAGYALEDDVRLFAFYVDGWVDVLELDQVGMSVFSLALSAAKGGYALEYLMKTYLTRTFVDEEKLALSYLDYISACGL